MVLKPELRFFSCRITCLMLLVVSLMVQQAYPASQTTVKVSGKQILLNGKNFVVRGIEYSPWGPGTGPGRGEWPEKKQILKDKESI